MTSQGDSERADAGGNAEDVLLRRRVAELSCDLAEQTNRARELADEAARFRAVADCTYDVECWVGADGRLVWVNRAVERLTGYSAAECLAMADFPASLVHEEDRARILEAFRDARHGSSGNDLPFRIRRRDGGLVWVAVSWQPICDPSGRCLGHRSSIRDISDRKQAEDRLIQQGKLLAGILANIPCGIFWKGRDFKYQGCNEAFARSAGVARPEDIVGRNDYELAWDVDQADTFRACDRRVMEENRPMYNIQETERQADGRQAILLTSKVPLQDADGRVWGLLGVDTDISELKRVEAELRQIKAELESRVERRTAKLAESNRRLKIEIAERSRAEAALRVSQDRYRLISELTSDYAYALSRTVDGDWRIEWFSDAFTRITGGVTLQLDPAGGWQGLIHPEDAAVMERRWQGLLSGRSVTAEYRIVTTAGRPLWLRDHARPLRNDATEGVRRILGAAQDITERKRAEDQARRHQDALAHVARLSTMGELTGQLAHELNQPLCTVVGNAQTAQRLLASPVPDAAELRGALDDIVAAGKHAGEVIRRLRSLVRQQQSQPTVLNLERLVEEVGGFIEADARRHGALVRFDIPDNLPMVRGDSIQLQQVLLNLVRNGLEAMAGAAGRARELTVRVDHRGREVTVGITDRGAGLSAETSARAFEPFFTTKPAGLGLGLSISRSIVEAHGGRLWWEPNPEGGATFVVALPVLEESDA
ncbi:MAG: PAS domain S-box protein [Planctomycetes bacterium]|nr:PAS domain S-box protein [Planctomycetota bacterium]